jgi:hypothetical protein
MLFCTRRCSCASLSLSMSRLNRQMVSVKGATRLSLIREARSSEDSRPDGSYSEKRRLPEHSVCALLRLVSIFGNSGNCSQFCLKICRTFNGDIATALNPGWAASRLSDYSGNQHPALKERERELSRERTLAPFG